MIDQLFSLPNAVERLRHGPLSEHLDTYATAVAQQGYARHSIRTQVVVIADLSRWLQQKHLVACNLDGRVVDRFLRHRQRKKENRQGDACVLNRFLTMLGQMGVVEQQQKAPGENPRQNTIHEFRRYLLQGRGLSARTLQYYVHFIEQFLSERFPHKTLNLGTLHAADVTEFVQRQAHRLSPEWPRRCFSGDDEIANAGPSGCRGKAL
jgi:site-specific recombinase XerD